MANFTELLNKGIRKYLDKYTKERPFGACENCQRYDLLICFEDPFDDNSIWKVCEFCYKELLNEEVV